MNKRSIALILSFVPIAVASAQGDGFSSAQIQSAYNALTPAVCLLTYSSEITNSTTGDVTKRQNHALGILVTKDGLILAHGHMELENRKPFSIKARLGRGDEQEEYDVEFLSKPDDLNVCFLQIETDEDVTFPFVEFVENPSLALGDTVLLFGVLGQSLDYETGFDTRRIGAILDEPRRTYVLNRSVSFGYVGSPVINNSGEALGVMGFDLSRAEGGELYTRSGHPLVYQADLFQHYIKEPPVKSEKEDAWLGVFTQPLTDDLAEYWGLPKEGGVVVSTVIGGSPAAHAGFRSGDVLVEFNGTPVDAKLDQEVLSFTKLVRESPLEQVIPVRMLRDGVPKELKLTLVSRPKAAKDARQVEDKVFGLTVREITTDVRIQLNLSDDMQGVIIARVKSGSPANLARLRRNFIILRMGDHTVASLEDFETTVEALTKEKPDQIAVFCRVGAGTAFFRMQPRWEKE